jgi:acyl-CoA thioesterase FadM
MERILALDDIDAAGVAFGPRLIALAHHAFEQAMADAGAPLPDLLRDGRWAMPLVRIESTFTAPLRHGDRVGWTVRLERLGDTSATLRIDATTAAGPAYAVTQVHVCLDRTTGRPAPWPVPLRTALERLAD